LTDTCADWAIKFLDSQEIEFIFSHPSGPVLPLYESLRKSTKPKNVLVRHEGAGSFMADAYSKVTGKVGVCMSTMGPGAANMTIGVATAMSDSTPILAITGQMALKNLGRGYQQETNHNELFRGITKASIQVKQASSFAEVLERAYKIAISGRPGPVHIDFPVDVSSAEFIAAEEPSKIIPIEYGSANKHNLLQAAAILRRAASPIILAGGGVIMGNATRELTEFVETHQIPVATSYNGRGAIREDHPLSLGRVGEFTPSYSRNLIEFADVIVALGYRFTDVSTEGWKIASQSKIIQIDIDPLEIGKNFRADVGILGNVKEILPNISKELENQNFKAEKPSKWIKEINDARSRWKQSYSSVENSDSIPIKPQRVMKELSSFVDDEVIIAAGAGRAKMWAASVLPILKPRTWIHSGGYAVMGYELCAALSAKLARPSSKVIAICGDASFQMHCQELATAVEQESPFLAVVLNDKTLASIRNAQLKKYGKDYGTSFKLDVNLADVARAFGAEGWRIESPSDLSEGIRAGLESSKPFVLDVVIDGSEIPTFEMS
jgi:acetolactate synthase I/II/III large subunit